MMKVKRLFAMLFICLLPALLSCAFAEDTASLMTDRKTFNDYEYDNQWYISKSGIDQAWALGYLGTSDIVVAVIDSGYSLDCDDFDYSRIYMPYDVTTHTEGLGTGDTVGHGTNIINMIAASRGNSRGISGILSGVKIMPVKVADEYSFPMDNLIEGINYAASNGADVINISIGGYSTDGEELYEACINAVDKGCIVIASAGNSGVSSSCYPAAYDEVIGVGAADTDGSICSFSNRGENSFVLAYGKYIGTYSKDNRIEFVEGTSIAAPQVAALAALLKSRNASLNQEEFMDILKNSSANGIVDYVAAIRYMNGKKGFKSVSVPSAVSYLDAKSKKVATVKNMSGKTITLGTSYTVTYKGDFKCGRTSVIVKGIGNYEDIVTKSTVIRPAKAEISSLYRSQGLTVIKVRSQYTTGMTGYQVKYKRNGGSKWYTAYITGKSLSKTFKKLKKGKTYYFKTRAYVKVNGYKYYGPYSSSKKIKVK